MADAVLSESDVMSLKDAAFAGGQFVAYFQPQYNHTTGLVFGAEALARWESPEFGLITPSVFVPVFEKYGEIGHLDLVIFEDACRLIERCRTQGLTPPPISVNVARHDLYQDGFIDCLEEVRLRYDVPVELLRIEITESSAVGGVEHVNSVIEKFHALGYLVEMDDFGSGYSSLNMLKNIDVDVLKLDMDFLRDDGIGTGRGGAILSSVVRMARLIGLPVIAEGVETKKQADYLRDIGCENMQGFYYSKPLAPDAFVRLLEQGDHAPLPAGATRASSLDASKFWDPNSIETLIFSDFVGPAAIFHYAEGRADIVRVNAKYLVELGMNMTVDETFGTDVFASMDDAGRAAYRSALERAIETGKEQTCETKRLVRSECCGDECLYVRSEVKLIGRNGADFLFYAMIRNVTAEKKRFVELAGYEHSFKQVTEQVNIYYWEYTVATKEMRPCFRCMRDLGLPPVVYDYPEPAFEAGIFPLDYADFYRDWHRQIEQGGPELEAVIPLTVGRVPFRVKYVTEFDELGRPVKAFGSATYLHPDEG